jgi:APA family basic amino acid/polyamine antiporter
VLALLVSTGIYLSVGIVAVGLIGAAGLGRSTSPLIDAISVLGNPILVYLISLGGLMATASVLLTSILGVSRLGFAMA